MELYTITRADMNALKSALEHAAAELEVIVLEGDVKEDVLLGVEEALSIINSSLSSPKGVLL